MASSEPRGGPGRRCAPPPARQGRMTRAVRRAAPVARPAWRRGCSSSPTSCAARAWRSGTSELLDAFAALDAVSWTDREDFREALAATLAKSQEDRRVLELVFDRFFFRAVEREAVERGSRRASSPARGRRSRADGPRRAARARSARRCSDAEGTGRRAARPGPPGDLGLRAPGRGLGRDRRRRAANPAHARAEAASGGQAELPDPDAVPRDRLREFEGHMRRELERALIERTQSLPPSQAAARVRPRAAHRRRPGPGRGAPRGGAAAPAAGHPGPRDARPQALAGDRRAPHDAHLAVRPAACRSTCATARAARAGPSCSCSATCRRAVTSASASSSCRCCTRCTTRSASCARSCSWSGSPR